jgi:glycine/D-amino acid oxidase-like deaminating enzyme
VPPDDAQDRFECVVVGGGLSGLAAGLRLAEQGVRVAVLEASEEVGGRARTIEVDGRAVDRGFQSLFTAYPATKRLIRDVGIRDVDLVPFDRGSIVHGDSGWSRMGTSLRGTLGFTGFTAGDVARLGRLGAEIAAVPADRVLWGDEREMTMLAYLQARGFSDRAIEGFFRPLFGVITADRSLGSDAGYFRFLMQMLVRGRAVIPVEGHGMIARWTAAALQQAGGALRMGAKVVEVITEPADRGRASGVRLEGGHVVRAGCIVLATEAPASRRLLDELDRQSARALDLVPRGVTTLVYALTVPLYSGRTIILNGAREPSAGARIDLVCQESNLLPRADGLPDLVLATSVDGRDGAADADDLARAMEGMIARWSPRFRWRDHARLAEVIRHDDAQFAVLPGVRDDLPGPATALDNVLLAGDQTMHPSIEGAVASGERAAALARTLVARQGGMGPVTR